MPLGRGVADRLPDFPWDMLAPYAELRAPHPERHRRPVGRHARRPGARGRAGRPARGRRRARATRRPRAARAARRQRRLAAAPDLGADVDPTPSCRPSAPRSSSRRCRCCSAWRRAPGRHPRARLPDVRRRRRLAGCEVVADRRARSVAGAVAGLAELAEQPDRARCSRVEHLAKVVAWARERARSW